jgi:hypothetical protein
VAEATAPPPSREEAAAWVGWALDEAGGGRVGSVIGVYVDAESGSPAWLVVALTGARRPRRRRRETAVAVPVRECAGAAGRVWIALGREALRSAPHIDSARPLLREHELAIGAHYGIGEDEGRCAEVAGRPAGAITSS